MNKIEINDLTKELSVNFIDYAYAVNTDRAIPDAKSGLKPVAKRILWSAYEEGRISSKPHVKAARIVGDVMGRYHPHGDSSIYGAMVRLSQPWVMRYPLIDWHGNNGNIAGDGPAAARYTEARLSKLSEEGLLQGIKKKNVNFIPNYDETLEEPITLPAVFPNLLCNPNTGIGVAMACNWAPHNLIEVATAINDYLDGKEPMLPGPDFPTGGIIINKNDIPKIMETGHGTVKIRARYNIEDNKIIFYEIPYGETIEGLIAEVGKLCEEKEIEGISDIHDESSKKIRIVITCEKNIDPNIIISKLYTKTNFQTSFSYNQVALINKTPTELNLKDSIKIYINHNLECIIKETNFDLAKAKARKEIVDGLLRAIVNIDEIITLIKNSESSNIAKISLIEKYSFTDNQAKAILAMRLSSLAKLEGIELEKEKAELENNIEKWEQLINNKELQINLLKEKLADLVKKYGDERRTELVQIEENKEEIKNEIIPQDVVVIITHNGNIKRIPKHNFKIQHKNGKGVKTLDDAILRVISTNTIDTLMVFTSLGKMYKINVDKIPEGTNNSKGVNLKTLLPFKDNENVQAINSLKDNYNNVIFFTKKGLIRKTRFTECSTLKKTTGIQAIKLKEDDELIHVTFIDDKSDILLITKKGMSIKVPSDDIKPIGRVTSGVKGISLKDNDEVISALVLDSKEKDQIVIVSAMGKGKRITLKDFIIQGRGGKGVSCIKLDSNDFLVSAALITDESSLLIIGKPNSICIKASEVPNQTKTATGVKLIENSNIIFMTKL